MRVRGGRFPTRGIVNDRATIADRLADDSRNPVSSRAAAVPQLPVRGFDVHPRRT
jgi:hypothetical protein